MEEFRKQFEYEEEKGVAGFLLIFFIMMLFFEPTLSIIVTAKGYQFFSFSPVLKTAFLIAAVLIITTWLFECILLIKINKLAVPFVKFFFAARIVFYIPCFIINTVDQLNNIPYPKTFKLYKMEYFSKILIGIISIIYIIAFSVLWWVYFNKSKRVKSYYCS